MTVFIQPGYVFFGIDLGKTETMVRMMERIPARRIQVEDPAQRDPPVPKHHDHLIRRHIRSPRQTIRK